MMLFFLCLIMPLAEWLGPEIKYLRMQVQFLPRGTGTLY
jgi:hypothetical protein